MSYNTINKILSPLEGYLIAIENNSLKGWYEITMGIPFGWVYNENDIIDCDVQLEDKNKGVVLKIYPKDNNVTIDNLIDFCNLILDTNSKIAEKEEEFNKKINSIKEELEKQTEDFKKNMELLKKESFQKLNKENNNQTPKTKRRRTPKKNVDNDKD